MGIHRTYGWHSSFKKFCESDPILIRHSLTDFIEDPSSSQIRAWDISIPALQHQEKLVIEENLSANQYHDILEYQLPLESRRPDAVLLSNGAVMVIEFKGKDAPNQADIDQVSAYARDLRCYHRECENRPVHPVLVPLYYQGPTIQSKGTHIVGIEDLHSLHNELITESEIEPVPPEHFLHPSAYSPLPTLVQAARELFEKRELRNVWRARAITDPAVEHILQICQTSAAERSKHLVLLTGVPGSGKTLVGLRIVHDETLDKITVERAAGTPTAPAVFLSGNAPLVEVLQYVLGGGKANGKTFVRGVKDYVQYYAKTKDAIPNEHLIVFDEAQRAWDKFQVAEKHDQSTWGSNVAKSEPEHFIEFAERIPEWCVVVGLIGEGQEIHVGEEGGLVQWKWAIENSTSPNEWQVHGPPSLLGIFNESQIQYDEHASLSLDTEIRFHLIPKLHDFINHFIEGAPAEECKRLADELVSQNLVLYVTRDINEAKKYLLERYHEDDEARYGLVASSRDKYLTSIGIFNDYQSTKNVRLGPYYYDEKSSPKSCCNLTSTITEFQAQGLEMDMVLLCWGTDFLWKSEEWSIKRARGFKNKARVQDPMQLRMNAYRVLLTRGRDGSIVYIPNIGDYNETYNRLLDCGFAILNES